ncbi:MAG: glycosyltransferase family 4 protein [Terrimicrobiaceae bacterium]
MSMVPWQIRDAVRAWIECPQRRRAAEGFARIRRDTGSVPSVGFGGVLEAGPLHGGAVKLLPLREAFGGGDAINILYAVSSKQPRFASDLFAHCRKSGIRIVWNQNGVGYPAWAGRESERLNRPMRSLRAMADHVIYQSEFCRESAEKFLGPCAVKSEVLYNPVDLEKFHPPANEPPGKPLRLLALGTHGYAGRVFAAVECLSILRAGGIEATLTIAGRMLWRDADGEVRRLVRVRKLESAVAILPPFSQEEAAELYRSHHMVLHPKYMDPCPTVVVEALASGCPVVGSKSGGMPELVGPDGGVLVEAAADWARMITPTGAELAAAVGALLPRLADARVAARQRAQRLFDVTGWVARHAEIFSGVLG